LLQIENADLQIAQRMAKVQQNSKSHKIIENNNLKSAPFLVLGTGFEKEVHENKK
jgi:hypothetical protein